MNAGDLNLPFKFHRVDIKFMAKLNHLKEIIDCETDNAQGKLVENQKKHEFHTRAAKRHSLGHKFLDEIKLWKTALQVVTPTNHFKSKEAR
jgi:hypothetical protein